MRTFTRKAGDGAVELPPHANVRVGHVGGSGTQIWIDFDFDLAVVLLTQVHQSQTVRFRQRLGRTTDRIFREAGHAGGAQR